MWPFDTLDSDPSSTGDMPSELGGNFVDYNPDANADPGPDPLWTGGGLSDFMTGQGAFDATTGQGDTFGGGGGGGGGALDFLSGLGGNIDFSTLAAGQWAPPLDTSIPFTDGGAMPDYSTMDDASGAIALRGLPWGIMTRMVGVAVRTFGPLALSQVIPMIASYFTARTGKMVTPQQLLARYLKKSGRRRSSRGITGRQLSITRRTIGKVQRMHAMIASIAGRGRRASHHPTAGRFGKRRAA